MRITVDHRDHGMVEIEAESTVQAAREFLRTIGLNDIAVWDRFPPDPEAMLHPESRFVVINTPRFKVYPTPGPEEHRPAFTPVPSRHRGFTPMIGDPLSFKVERTDG